MAKSKNLIEWAGDSGGAMKATADLGVKVAELEGKLTKMQGAGKRASKGITTELTGMVMQFATVGAVIAGVTKALRTMREEREAAAGGIRGTIESKGALAQLATSPAHYQQMVGAAEASRLRMPDEQAYALQFTLESAGIGGKRGLYAGLYPAVKDPAQLATAVQTIQSGMGRGEAGTHKDILNKLLTASGRSPADLLGISAGAARAAPLGAQLQMSDEEVMAAVAMVAWQVEGTDPMAKALGAGTRIRAFQKVMMKKGMGGMGLVGAARKIEGMGLSDKRLQTWMGGRIEAMMGYRGILGTAGDIESLATELRGAQALTGGPEDAAAQLMAIWKSDPRNRAWLEEWEAKQGLQVTRERALGGGELTASAAFDAAMKSDIESGKLMGTRFVRRLAGEAVRHIGGGAATIRGAMAYVEHLKYVPSGVSGLNLADIVLGAAGGTTAAGGPQMTKDDLDDVAERLGAAAGNLDRATGDFATHERGKQRAAPGGEY